MVDQESKFKDLSKPLILTNLIASIPDKSIVILKIRDLIQIKYFNKINSVTNFMLIKKEAMDICDVSKQKTSLLNETIQYQEIKLNKLYNEKKLLEQNRIQSDIIQNQKKLIDNYKQNNADLILNLNESEKKLNEKDQSNRKLLTNDAELKNTISRYIAHNKKLQDNINQLKAEYSEISLTNSQIDEMTSKINFYQDDNVRLSNKIFNIQKKYETIKLNFDSSENEKDLIFKKIQNLNNSITNANIIGTPYMKEKVQEDSITSKVLNDITNKNLKDEKINLEENEDLNDKINNIFK